MLISEILFEANTEYNRTKALTADEFKALMPQLKLALSKTEKGDIIYRGSPNPNPIVYTDPTGVERVSRNTSNELTLLVSHILPSWQSWPKRSRSLICSEEYRTAGSYSKGGGPYIVLPLGDPMIAVVPGEDFWDSFDMFPPDFNHNFGEFFKTFRLIAEEAGLNVKLPAAISTPEDMVHVLKTYDAVFSKYPQILEKMKDELSSVRMYRIGVMTKLLATGNSIEALDAYFNPKANNFAISPYSDYRNHLNYEVWFSGPAVLIRKEAFDKLMN